MVSLNGLPGIAQPALQEGKYVGKVIRARLDGDASVAPFKYFDKGSMATIGRTHAVARSGGMSFTGIVAYLMWAFIHVLYLIGWGNRFGTLYSWGRSLWFTKNRAHRTITLDQAIDEIGGHGSASGSDDWIGKRGAGDLIEAVERGWAAPLRVARMVAIASRLLVPVAAPCAPGCPAPS